MLNFGPTKIWTLMKSRTLESVKIGASRRINVASIKRLAETGTPGWRSSSGAADASAAALSALASDGTEK